MGIGINGFVGTMENVQRDLTTQKMNFSIKDFLSKCDQIRMTLRIWSHLLKKSLTEIFTFWAVPMLGLIRNLFFTFCMAPS